MLFFGFLSCSGVYQHLSTFWSITLQHLGADQATIPHMKGHCCSFHMRHRNLICNKRLQRFGMIMRPWESPLVLALPCLILGSQSGFASTLPPSLRVEISEWEFRESLRNSPNLKAKSRVRRDTRATMCPSIRPVIVNCLSAAHFTPPDFDAGV